MLTSSTLKSVDLINLIVAINSSTVHLIAVAESLGIEDLSDVILSRKRLSYLDELCKTKGVVGEPVIFQTKEDMDKKKASILGDGSSDIEKALYWTLEQLGQITSDLDLRELMRLSDEEISAKDYRVLNVVTVYILSRLATSQSMGLIGAGFKSPKHAVGMLSKRFAPLPDADIPLGSLPYVTRQTVSYALSLVISAVSYSRTCILTKGRAPMTYEKLYDDFAKLTDEDFQEELRILIRSYLINTTATEVQPTAAASASAATPRRAAATAGGGGGDAGSAPLVAAAAGGGSGSDGEGNGDAGDSGGSADDAAAGGGNLNAGAAAATDTGSGDASFAGSQTSTPKPSPGAKAGKKGSKKTDAVAVPVKKAGSSRTHVGT